MSSMSDFCIIRLRTCTDFHQVEDHRTDKSWSKVEKCHIQVSGLDLRPDILYFSSEATL